VADGVCEVYVPKVLSCIKRAWCLPKLQGAADSKLPGMRQSNSRRTYSSGKVIQTANVRLEEASMEKHVSFQDYAIVACGTINMELNHLKDSGVLDARKILYTKPGRHEAPP